MGKGGKREDMYMSMEESVIALVYSTLNFFRNNTSRRKKSECLSNSDPELYDGFSGPWSWETTSLQEMGFPPTPDTEPKNKTNTNKKGKKKKKLTVTGEEEEEEDDLSDIRTLETLDELKARLKSNYIEAKNQREKYLNLAREQSSEEKRVKSVKGTRDKSKEQQNLNKNKKNTTDVTVNNIGNNIINGEVSGPQAHVNVISDNNISSIADSFQNELESIIFKSGNLMPPDVPKTPNLNVSKSSISSEQTLTDSPSKPLLKSSDSATSSSLDKITNLDKNGSLEYFVPDTSKSEPIGVNNKLNVVVQNHINNSSDVSPAISSDDNIVAPSDSRQNIKRKSKKKHESRSETVKDDISGFDSKNDSFGIEDNEKKEEKEEKEDTKVILSFATVDSSPAEESANESVIQNDNIELDIGLTGSGLGNVMDMLSNW